MEGGPSGNHKGSREGPSSTVGEADPEIRRLCAAFLKYSASCTVGPSRAERGIAAHSYIPLTGKMPALLSVTAADEVVYLCRLLWRPRDYITELAKQRIR
jgi:hypothetical protein